MASYYKDLCPPIVVDSIGGCAHVVAVIHDYAQMVPLITGSCVHMVVALLGVLPTG